MKNLKPLLIAMGIQFSLWGLAQKIELVVDPDPVRLTIADTLQLNVKAIKEGQTSIELGRVIMFALRESDLVPSSAVEVQKRDGKYFLVGHDPGMWKVEMIRIPQNENETVVRRFVEVEVVHAPIASIEVNRPAQVFEGTVIPLEVNVLDELGLKVRDPETQVTISNPNIAEVDELMNLYAIAPGKTTITVAAGGIEHEVKIEVERNPVVEINLEVSNLTARTGDVLQFSCITLDSKGRYLPTAPILFSIAGSLPEAGSGASAQIDTDGRFVAEKQGIYTIVASSGGVSATKTVKITPRNIQRQIQLIGQGSVSESHTSDFWVWEGVDGRDYAVTGTWGADGKAFFWDVTDPANIFSIDTVQVDARTVNDVKVSADGSICIISREGASNRKNGIVIIDVTNPREAQILSTYTEQLTGGVHNLFIYEDHVYALSNSQRYEIINIEDPANPYRVSKFEIDNPGRAIHDVWIEDGIAYSSNWNDGVIMVDVGNGIKGGSPSNPVMISSAKVEGNANHAAFPYTSTTTGKRYVIAGDEIFPVDFDPNGVILPKGYLHFMDFTDLEHPKEVARYQVPEAGSHNFWVKDDLLYIGYYNGGVRVVDISGDLMGDLYKQGREVAHFLPMDPEGYIPNAAMTWGAQPHKGHIFFSDFHSGLWAAKLAPIVPEEVKIDAK